jgi:GT2 family glycosyltransferase
MVSILLPTTGRPGMAERCINGIRETTQGHSVEIVCAVDADEESRDRLTPLVEKMLYSGSYRGCSNAWNDCLRMCEGDPVVFAADDLRWGSGWLEKALACLQEFQENWGLVGFNDGHWGPELSTHYLLSRRFIVEVLGGVVAWPFYKHSFNDLEVNERAKRAGRYTWCEDAHVVHEHWLFGDRAQDSTDTRTLGEHPACEQIYHRRAAAGFPNDFEPVITG